MTNRIVVDDGNFHMRMISGIFHMGVNDRWGYRYGGPIRLTSLEQGARQAGTPFRCYSNAFFSSSAIRFWMDSREVCMALASALSIAISSALLTG